MCSVPIRWAGDGPGDSPLISRWKPDFGLQALTLQQPWAYCVANGLKRYETRSWETNHRGLLAIHAGSNAKPEHFRTAEKIGLDINDKSGPFWADRGKIIAISELAEITQITNEDELAYWRSTTEADYGFYNMGSFVWRLENVLVLPRPVATRGNMGIWYVDRVDRDTIGSMLGVS